MKNLINLAISSAILLQITACGDGKLSLTIDSDIMSGVAATGAPISSGTVEIKGKNGVVVVDVTSSDGSYSANIAALEEPYLVRVIAPSGEKYISVASKSALAEGKKINVTPLSHTIVANVFEKADADDLFENFETDSTNFSEAKLEDEKGFLLQKFIDAGLLGDGKIAAANIDLLNGDLKAGTSIGLDGLLDVLDVNTGAVGGVEIKLKGEATPFIVDKVNAADAPVVNVSASVAAAKVQLSVIDVIRVQMNSLASLYSSLVGCNGAAKDDGSYCDVDNLHALLLPYFHADFQEDGKNRDAAVWSWVCERDGDDASSKADCMASGIEFSNVYLKDISLISYDAGSKVALISLNVYQNGKLGHAEEMTLKYDSGNGKYKMMGNKKTFEYWIDTESVHSTEFNKTSNSAVESYDVNLNFHYKNAGAHGFSENQSFTLTAVSGHNIFPGGNSSMNLYLVKAPVYDESNSCSAGLGFSTSLTPYKVYNHADGSSSNASFASACTNNDPCNCMNGSVMANFDHEANRMVKLSLAEIVNMDKFEKISLVGGGASDEFVIKKPLVVNANNAAKFIPQFGMSSSALCFNSNLAMSLNLSVASGVLSDVNIHYGVSNSGAWDYESAREELWDSEASSYIFSPAFSSLGSGDVIEHTNLYLSARDVFDRRFVRRVNCFN